VSDAGAMPAKSDARIAQLGEALHPGITTDPHWPTLAQQLYLADREGLNEAYLRSIATARPLPIDHPAAALAYRLIDAIGDRKPVTGTTEATSRTRPTTAGAPAPEPVVRRPYQSSVRRPNEPPHMPSPPPDYSRIVRPQPQHRPRR
jgi:hypothetical protein